MRMVSIGADPELFVQDDKGVSSVIGKLGGSKWEPRMLGGYGIQEDNVLAEFSMPAVPYFQGAGTFSASVEGGIERIRRELASSGLRTHAASSWLYTEDQLKQYGPAALEFGCDPDKNAYTGDENPRPDSSTLLRTAGGHIHFGLPIGQAGNEQLVRMVVMAMDIYLGLPSVFIDRDKRRRELYGKAGAYRWKPYGGEYRTLSNFWIHSHELRLWVYHQTEQAVKAAKNIHLIHTFVDTQAIQDCINESNEGMAIELCKKLGIHIPKKYLHELKKEKADAAA